ncbi:hypothetical protein HanHA300_Chr03g0077511 [Helianthus annuus]|nr:hypothetical protein HanHA300_Chr03g0077511 [Helianthus annuus]
MIDHVIMLRRAQHMFRQPIHHGLRFIKVGHDSSRPPSHQWVNYILSKQLK